VRHLLPDQVFQDGALRPGLAVALDGACIAGVVSADALPHGAEIERLPGRALLPGFVNAHSHAFQRGLRGHVQHTVGADSFWTWRDRMYRLANALDPDGVEAVSALAFLEMVRAGFTTVGEFHYLQHAPDGTPYADPDELARRVVSAARRVGIHIVLLRVAYGRAGFGLDPNPLQRRFYDATPDDVLAATERLRATGVNVGLAPHSVRACPADWLRAFSTFEGPIHAHVDEQPAEIEASLREHGRRPLHAFADAGLVRPGFVAVHLTHPDDAELGTLDETGAAACVCPTTELDLGDGFFPLERLLSLGRGGAPPRNAPPVTARLSIGTDSHAQIDPFAEIRAIELHARAVTGRRNVWAHADPDGLAAALIEVGTAGGAAALGVGAGRIAPGARADLVAVDLTAPAVRGARPLPALVFAGHPGLVRDVWVGGRRIVDAGVHPFEGAILAEAERALARTEA
jgi:formimidoylglutamate deiminase